MRLDLLYGLLWLFGGVGAWWMAYHMTREVRRTRDWPTAPGQILERGITDRSPLPGYNYRGRERYPYVKYTFVVGGKEYTNDRVYSYGTVSASPAVSGYNIQKLQAFVDGLPSTIAVHYDPQDPSRAYLFATPIRGVVWIAGAFGVVALLVGLMYLASALASPRP